MVHVYIDPRCGELRSQLAAALPTLSLVDEADLEKARAFVIQAGSWPQLERVITTHRQIHLPGMLPVIVLVDDAGRDAAERLVEAGQASEVLPDGASWETVAARIYYWTLERNAADKTNALFSVLNTIPAGVMILIDGEIAFANQLAAGSVRRELAALQGARLEELVHPDDRQFLVRVFRRDAADAGLESLDLRLIGEGDHWLGLRSRPIYFLDRPGFFLSVIDITETKLSDLKRAYQAQLLDLVEDAVITTDRDARITFWNQGAENLYGRPAAAVLGRPWAAAVAPLEAPSDGSTGAPDLLHQGEWFQPRANGQKAIIEQRVVQLVGPNGQSDGTIAVNRNVTRRVRMQKQVEARLRDFVSLVQVSQVLFAGGDLKTVAQTACDLLLSNFGAASAWITYHPQDGQPVQVAHAGELIQFFIENLKDDRALAIRNHLFERIINQGEMVLVEDLAADPEFKPFIDLFPTQGALTTVVLPLIWKGERVGMIGLVADRGEFGLPDRLETVKLLAGLVAIGLNNTFLYENLERNLKEVKILNEIGSRLQKMRSPEEIADEIIRIAEELMGYEYSAILTVDEDGEHLRPFAVSDQKKGGVFKELDRAFIESKAIKVGHGVTGWVAASGRSLRIGDVRQDPRYIPLREDIRSELCVPLLIGGQTVGVFNVETTRLNAFSENDQRLLETVSSQFAIAITNAQLLEKLQDSTTRLRGLTRRLSEAHEAERIFLSQELHDEAGQLLTALRMSLRLLRNSLAEEPPETLERLGAAETLAEQLLLKIRQIASGLRPPAIQTLGLERALEELINGLREQTGLQITCAMDELPPLSDLLSITIYRCLQEAVTNAIRHADASEIAVIIEVQKNQIVMLVSDNGRGMPAPRLSGKRVSLRSIENRLDPVMGSLLVETPPPNGTRVRMTIPL